MSSSESALMQPPSEGRVNRGRLTMILGALSAFAPFATDMYLSSFPSISKSLHTTVSEVQLSLSAFFLGLALGQLFYGPLIDRYGRRRPLLGGILIFTFASLLLMLAPNIQVFVGLRFLQAIGGCAGMIVSRAIIKDVFDERESARALSMLMTIQGVGPIVAPIVGGYILSVASWQAVFGFLVAFGAACFMTTLQFVPETLPAAQRRAASLGQIFKSFGTLLTRREFIVPTLAVSFAFSGLFAFISGSPFVFMSLHGVSQQHYGWLFGLNATGMVLASQLNRAMLKRLSPRKILTGAVLVSISAASALMLASETASLTVFLIPQIVCLSMVPLLASNGVALAMSASAGQAGTASSIVGVMQFGIASIASALVGIFHNGTAYPMTAMIFTGSLLAGATLLLGRRRD